MKLISVIFSLALLSGVANAEDHARRIYLQGTGNITHADGSSDKYLVSMLIKKHGNTKIIYCRYLGFDFDYMNKIKVVKHDNGTASLYRVGKGANAHSGDKIGHGFFYKDDAFHMIMHMHDSKGNAVDVHFETDPSNPEDVIVRGMASKGHTMVHLWENRLSTIYSEHKE